MPRQTAPAPVILCDLVKLLRAQWLSRPQITNEMGIHENTCRFYVAEMTSNGLLREAKSNTRLDGKAYGRKATIYSLSPEWGGQAEAIDGQGEGVGRG
jgi:predicted ArsR family transcriptional regulator